MALPVSPTPESGNAEGGHTGSTWGTAVRLLRYAVGVDSRMLGLTVGTALASSIAEGFGLVLLLPLLSVAGMNFNGPSAAGRLSVMAQGVLVRAGVPQGLWLPVVLGIFLATGAARSLLRRSQSMMSFTATTKVGLALSREVYEAVVRAQWGFLVRQRAGKLTHVLTQELRHVEDALSLLLSLINISCLTLLYLVFALKLSAPMTGLVVAMGGVLLWLQRTSLGKMRVSGRSYSDSSGEVYAATEEHLLNLKSVKTYNAEERDVQMFGRLCNEVAHHSEETARHQAASDFRFEVGTLAALGMVIFLALSLLRVPPATMLLLLAIFTRLMPQLAVMQTQAHIAASLLPSYDNVLATEAECAAHAERETSESGEDAVEFRLERELRLEEVWFAYQTRSAEMPPEFVLRGIDLGIEAGMVTAVVGPSGAGKSTIADLVNGLLLPTRGQLLVDGRALETSAMRAWRRKVGYVGQETVLFHQSVRENLLWAQPGATEEELREALLLASAGFVYDLPRGLETVVGDRGILLSSGQRQRISLARALLRKPALLILDEATNALDVENEARVLDAIREAVRESRERDGGTLTVLMIAHRASAICRADRIFELEGGRVARSGTWETMSSATEALP